MNTLVFYKVMNSLTTEWINGRMDGWWVHE